VETEGGSNREPCPRGFAAGRNTRARDQRALPQRERGNAAAREIEKTRGRSLVRLEPGGAELTATMRFEKGQGRRARSGFAGSGLPMVEVQSLSGANIERKPARRT